MYILFDPLSFLSAVIGNRSPAFVNCAMGVLSEQCGEEITGVARAFVSRVQEIMGCTKRKR